VWCLLGDGVEFIGAGRYALKGRRGPALLWWAIRC